MARARISPAVAWGALVAVGLFAAWLRYGVIEPAGMAQQCAPGEASPAWCGARQWLVLGFLNNSYGLAALATTALACVWRRPGTAWTAAALGFVALQLYCYQSGALALLVGCLLLLRSHRGIAPTPLPAVTENRRGHHQVQGEP